MAGERAAVVSDFIRHRPGRGTREWKTSDRRIRIYVRSANFIVDSSAQLVSCSDAAAVAVGDLAIGL